MSVIMKGRSTGPTTVELTHESGSTIVATSPKDNGGDGSSFSPTDLCAVSLGACGTAIMTMFARDKAIPVGGVEFELSKEMAANPRRIGKIVVTFRIKTACSETDFRKIVAAGKACPVRQTLGGAVEIEERYLRALTIPISLARRKRSRKSGGKPFMGAVRISPPRDCAILVAICLYYPPFAGIPCSFRSPPRPRRRLGPFPAARPGPRARCRLATASVAFLLAFLVLRGETEACAVAALGLPAERVDWGGGGDQLGFRAPQGGRSQVSLSLRARAPRTGRGSSARGNLVVKSPGTRVPYRRERSSAYRSSKAEERGSGRVIFADASCLSVRGFKNERARLRADILAGCLRAFRRVAGDGASLWRLLSWGPRRPGRGSFPTPSDARVFAHPGAFRTASGHSCHPGFRYGRAASGDAGAL
jgi:uncharacterized OsmC-like protein